MCLTEFLLPDIASDLIDSFKMEQENKDAPSTSKSEATTAPKEEGGCCKKFFSSFGGDGGHKWILHTVAAVAVGVIALHIYCKYRGGPGGHCCH